MIQQTFFEIPTIEYDRFVFKLEHPLIARGYPEKGLYFIECPMPQMLVWGTDEDNAIEALSFKFMALFKQYATADSDNLTPEAQFLKEQLLFVIDKAIIDDPTSTPRRGE